MPNLPDHYLCFGCTACVSICSSGCVKMEKDPYGFRHPVLIHPENCVECGMCERVCPALTDKVKDDTLPFAYAAMSKNEAVRFESSSGGVFTELARQIIAQKGVVIGAVYDSTFEVKHCCIDNEDDLRKLRGAKYSESDLEDTFAKVSERLSQGQKVLFSGTPCQVAGLKSYIRKDYDNLFCVDFVCHGVPSPMAWKAYVKYRAEQDADGELPRSVNLRSKNTGWSNYRYSNVFEYGNGNRHSVLSSDSLFMKLFVGDYISRLSCENCKFKGYSRVSDITLGDFWGIWDIDSEMDDGKGTSVVLIQSENGRALWNEISDKIKFKEVTLEQASRQNPSMLMSSKANPKREEVLNQIRAGRIDECESLFVQPKISMVDRIKVKIKRLLRKFHHQR